MARTNSEASQSPATGNEHPPEEVTCSSTLFDLRFNSSSAARRRRCASRRLLGADGAAALRNQQRRTDERDLNQPTNDDPNA